MKKSFNPNKISSYFLLEWIPLSLVTISGIIYNVGLLATPYFEGRLTQTLSDILNGNEEWKTMVILVSIYLTIVLFVQFNRFLKRFFVRRFANNVNRRMKGVLYANMLGETRLSLEKEGNGELMTKAISDVDDCSEGMRKFVTEIFDTGISFISFAVMLFIYDWRLAFISLAFTPFAYLCAYLMKKPIQRAGKEHKQASSSLNEATLDRAENALTYRIYGVEKVREDKYEETLTNYEKKSIRSNVWQTALSPLYLASTTIGVFFILYFGGKNVLHEGWQVWDIAALTTFLSCFAKLSLRSSKVAKLFNSVQKAEVSWKRIKPLMKTPKETTTLDIAKSGSLEITNLGFAYENNLIFDGLSLSCKPGDIIGVTGPIAGGKSTFGKAFLLENPYMGSILFNGRELSSFSPKEISETIGYLGHDPELISDSIKHNIIFDEDKNVDEYLDTVSLTNEVNSMEEKENTLIGNNGVRLSGGQQQRVALARTLAHPRPIIILDDPFSALDRKTEDEIFARLKEYGKDKIIFLISHRLYHFNETTKVIYMKRGGIHIGKHEKLLIEIPEYSALYESQIEGKNNEEKK